MLAPCWLRRQRARCRHPAQEGTCPATHPCTKLGPALQIFIPATQCGAKGAATRRMSLVINASLLPMALCSSLPTFISGGHPARPGPRAEPRLVFIHLKLQISTKQTYIKITLRNNPNHEGKEIPFFLFFEFRWSFFFFGLSPGKQTAEIRSRLGSLASESDEK